MTLQVVGTGLGRTGTHSLKIALTQLGFGPCHHMVEVLHNPASIPLWVEASKGRPDWEAIFDGYRSQVDYPGAKFWRELIAYYPDAKVIHTERDPDSWFDSTQASIFAEGGPTEKPPPHMAELFGMVLGDFGAGLHDRAFMTDYFRRHNAAVRAAVPAERLLVFEAKQGWDPLCAFLGAPVPAEPFPLTNTREEFQARVAAARGDPTKF